MKRFVEYHSNCRYHFWTIFAEWFLLEVSLSVSSNILQTRLKNLLLLLLHQKWRHSSVVMSLQNMAHRTGANQNSKWRICLLKANISQTLPLSKPLQLVLRNFRVMSTSSHFDETFWFLGQVFQYFLYYAVNCVHYPTYIMYSPEPHIFALIQRLFQYELIVVRSQTVWTLSPHNYWDTFEIVNAW